MQSEEFLFENQSLVLAYDEYNKFIGVFVTYPGEAFTKAELLDFFQNEAHHMIVADSPIPKEEGFVRDMDQSSVARQLKDFIERAADVGLEEDEILCYIPKYLH